MIEPNDVNRIMEFITEEFPGSTFAFIGGGGELIGTAETILIARPELEESFKKKLVKKFPRIPFQFFVGPMGIITIEMASKIHREVTGYLNRKFHPNQPPLFDLQFKPCFLLLQSSEPLDEHTVLGIRAVLDKYEVSRTLYIDPEIGVSVWEKGVKQETIKEEHAKVIGADDVTNLKISLNKNQDVLDFLKELEGQ